MKNYTHYRTKRSTGELIIDEVVYDEDSKQEVARTNKFKGKPHQKQTDHDPDPTKE